MLFLFQHLKNASSNSFGPKFVPRCSRGHGEAGRAGSNSSGGRLLSDSSNFRTGSTPAGHEFELDDHERFEGVVTQV